jgi:hypothetical protein
MMNVWLPEYNTPIVVYLTSLLNNDTTGQIYHSTGGAMGGIDGSAPMAML